MFIINAQLDKMKGELKLNKPYWGKKSRKTAEQPYLARFLITEESFRWRGNSATGPTLLALWETWSGHQGLTA